MRNGRINWGPSFTMSSTARATARARDPISFDILNPDTISTGIFAGLLPTAGSSGTFSTAFSNDLILDYNLASLGGANALVDFTLGGAGAAVAMPAPDTLLLAGTGLMLLGLFVRRSKASQGQ
ncbi:hypothetical protein [Duganella sp. HH101]|uniref:hypothetical protein n=1 Tax=Duganella sp. HH101 TaxID=1781066 RepID=UPI000875120B|nr:hypothetical protein [Duganella sp. HH101]OFA06401.1 hypothetical protein DUGA2_09410 [Duganella sp. HH101]